MDLNVRPFHTAQAALADPVEPDKRRESSRKGGLRGGKARVVSLSTGKGKETASAGIEARWGHTIRQEGGIMANRALLPEETQRYLEAHPNVDSQLERAERVYKRFDQYLNLTQRRVIVRESGGSTAEADLGAPILRTDL
jgi:hypothetical protein